MDTRAKVFVSTADASLAASLLAFGGKWDLQTGEDLDAAQDVDVVVCDVVTVEAGWRVLSRLAGNPRFGAVVVAKQEGADDPALDDLAFAVRIIVRPYGLTELVGAIDTLLEGASSTTSSPPEDGSQKEAPPPTANVPPTAQPPGRGTSGERDEPDDSAGPDVTADDPEAASSAPRDPIVRRREHAAAATTQERARGGGWFDRHIRRSKGPERQLEERLTRVAAATTDLEELLDGLPALGSLPTLAARVLDEVVLQLAVDSAGFWRALDDGWHQPRAHLRWRRRPTRPTCAPRSPAAGRSWTSKRSRVRARR